MDRDLAPPGRPAPDPSWVAAHAEGEQVLNRVIEPIDCGWAVAFLLSGHSRCITGQVLTIDAGLTARLYGTDTTERVYARRVASEAAEVSGS